MDLDARPYRGFVAIAEKKSFSAAARDLHISQPALSAQIRELERRIGFNLFARTSRTVELTAQGAMFLAHARRLILETEWINQTINEIRLNPLRIAAAHHTAQIEQRCTLIDRFVQAAPDVPLTVQSRTPAQIVAELRSGRADIGMLLQPVGQGEQSHSADENSADLMRISLGTRAVGLLVPGEHDWADKERIDADALKGQSICAPSRVHGIGLSETLARRLADFGASRVRAPEGDAQGIMRFASLLNLICLDLKWFPKPPLRGSAMVPLALDNFCVGTELVILASGDRRPAAEEFLAFARRGAEGQGCESQA